jgi:hypothetical protein
VGLLTPTPHAKREYVQWRSVARTLCGISLDNGRPRVWKNRPAWWRRWSHGWPAGPLKPPMANSPLRSFPNSGAT